MRKNLAYSLDVRMMQIERGCRMWRFALLPLQAYFTWLQVGAHISEKYWRFILNKPEGKVLRPQIARWEAYAARAA